MDFKSQIETVRQKLVDLSAAPKQVENTIFDECQSDCEKHGQFTQRIRIMKVLNKTLETRSECPSCLKEKLAKLESDEAEYFSRRKASEIDRLMDALLLPERFSKSTLDNYEPVNSDAAQCLKLCKAYAAKWPDRLKQGGGLVMCGKPGTGKNHLALAIAKHVITEHQSSAMFTTALRVARMFKSTWSKNAERSEHEVITAYTDPHLLIIDEVGVQFGSDAEKMILFEIINTRYERMKPTILISNLPKDELSAFIGERVIDRMNDGGGCTLAFTWDSYRSRAA
ncbi:ATP-binding protein [Winslowiella arboricola]